MARFVHRLGDSRSCGATTVTRVTNVRVNNRPISVDRDTNTHGAGHLNASETVGKVRANSIPVILISDTASPDNLCPIPGGNHCSPNASSASPNVRAGSG
tara:strand:+ start:117 stop:416 length:300 start_codon:yes stop_codon:yes gene_type:complete